MAHSGPNGNQAEAPGLCRISGHDLLGGRPGRYHRAEQRRAIQPQNQSVVSSGRDDVSKKWGV